MCVFWNSGPRMSKYNKITEPRYVYMCISVKSRPKLYIKTVVTVRLYASYMCAKACNFFLHKSQHFFPLFALHFKMKAVIWGC